MPLDAKAVFGPYEKDVRAFQEMAQAIRSGRSLALVGAGISSRAKLPSWDALLTGLQARLDKETLARDKAPDQRPRTGNEAALPKELQDDIPWHGEVLRSRLEQLNEDAYRDTLVATFDRDAPPDPCALLLAGLPFRHVLTTNYDRVMRSAMTSLLPDPPSVIDWTVEQDTLRLMHTLLDTDSSPHLIHLHGRIERPEGIVLTDRDYSRHYLRSDSTMRKLFAIFALNRVVFFGFSLNDADLMMLLRQVAGALTYQKRPRHFVVLGAASGYPRDDVRERLVQKFGVTPIFYDSSGGHQQLEPLLRELADVAKGRIHSSVATPTPVVTPQLPAADPGPAAVAPAAPAGDRRAPVAGGADLPAARRARTNAAYPDDPRKGMFGGESIANGRQLTGSVVPSDESPEWYEIRLRVEATYAQAPIEGTVTFYLHDTFITPIRRITARDGVAILEISAYGAFTVGVVVEQEGTELELDLAALPNAPKDFRES